MFLLLIQVLYTMYIKKYKGLLYNNQGPTLLIALRNQCTGEAFT